MTSLAKHMIGVKVGLIPVALKTPLGHTYLQSSGEGVWTNLRTLVSYSKIVPFTGQRVSEARRAVVAGMCVLS